MVYLMMGILLSRSVQIGRLASRIPLRVKRQSIVRRMERFLGNGAVWVRVWYEPIARGLLSAASASGSVGLVIDGTKVSFGQQLLMVAVVYRGRALPVLWRWVKGQRGHSSQHKQLALLSAVREWIPAGVAVSLVGDSEFGHTFILEYLDHWKWSYVLRQSGHSQVWTCGADDWQRLDALAPAPGEWCWLPPTVLTVDSAYPARLLLFWARGEKKPWLLATNLSHPPLILRLYTRRMWIEELFGDLKKHGFDLESSHLLSFLRLNRLTLAVAMLYVWLVSEGAHALANERAHLVDRSDRRDLSLFRLGLELIFQAISWLEPFFVHWNVIFEPDPDASFFQPATVG
jgi:hypothetical protein